MTTIKSYTDIEQSKKLAEFLPLDSADMFYDGVQDLYKEKVYNIPTDGSSITVRTGHVITDKGIKANLLLPCWSLAALLSVIKSAVEDYTMQSLDCKKNFIVCELGNKPWSITAQYNNEIDACVSMIEYLHEHKML